MQTAAAIPHTSPAAALDAAVWARGGRQEGREVRFLCPAHDDHHPSARWNAEKKTWTCDTCKAGGGWVDLSKRLGVYDTTPRAGQSARIVAAYDYRDGDGKLLYQALRYEPKDFKQRRPDDVGGWIWRLDTTPRVPYRLPELLAADPQQTVYVCEGEKDVDRLHSLGLVATTNVGGAGKWHDSYSEVLRGRHVAILPDNDEPGRKHAASAARSLAGKAASVKVVELPGLSGKGDVSEWLNGGGTERRLGELVAVAPVFPAAVPTVVVPAESILTFRTARELAAETPESVEWVAMPWAAVGCVTECDGKAKASGKTTLTAGMIAAVLEGDDFLGYPTQQTGAVYLTEQSPQSFRETLRRANLLERDDLLILHWYATKGHEWPAVVEAATAECLRRGYRLLIVDTLPQFAGLRGDGENNAGDALQAVEPLQDAAAKGIAVWLTRHERKGGGEVGESARGSSAFSGAVDIVLSLRRGEGNQRPSVRVIHALSRFDETPDSLVIELTPAGYVAHGDESALATKEARAALLEAAPVSEQGAKVFDTLLEDAEGVKRTVAQEVVQALVREGALHRAGAGKKGNPYRYWRNDAAGTTGVPAESNHPTAVPSSIHAAGTTTVGTAETIWPGAPEEGEL